VCETYQVSEGGNAVGGGWWGGWGGCCVGGGWGGGWCLWCLGGWGKGGGGEGCGFLVLGFSAPQPSTEKFQLLSDRCGWGGRKDPSLGGAKKGTRRRIDGIKKGILRDQKLGKNWVRKRSNAATSGGGGLRPTSVSVERAGG